MCIRIKIEKVPRGIRGEKSSKDMASSRNLVSTIGALQRFELLVHCDLDLGDMTKVVKLQEK